MPAIVGPVQVTSNAGGIVQFGDSLAISPKSSSKSVAGSGSSNTGLFIFNANGLSGNNILDLAGVDQPIAGNN
ncbi:spore germination protein [Peribacillus loiseleuriae]|uniref:Spore gernimation protein GerPF n=1 Tax=Peribacillus loiseleuriae TaxID=1679170 RepID=A0A0K9GQY9_9BACI|nr:spore germination protein [Peribacillus loiseleuriae]KMY49048.1 spore gernimation protein GerPF [Peribacillus loiseleuriae]